MKVNILEKTIPFRLTDTWLGNVGAYFLELNLNDVRV